MSGLCGNFNEEPSDDTMLRGGAIAANIAKFADDWRVHHYCQASEEISLDTACKGEGQERRKKWAKEKCGVMSSSLFKPCHPFVDNKEFIERSL